MTAAERRLFAAFRRVTGSLQPAMQRAYLRAWELVRAALTPGEVERLLASGSPDTVVRALLTDEVLARAFAEVTAQIQLDLGKGAAFEAARMPPRLRNVISAEAGIGFNVLNPRVIDAVRTVQMKHVASAQQDARHVIQAFVEDGLRDGVNPRTIARRVRGVVGLGPTQWQEVRNFRRALETGDVAKALGYVRRDRRFDASIRKGDLTPAQIDTMVEAYTKRRIALNAETAARTSTLDSLRRGQRFAWEESIALGAVDRSDLRQRWVTTLDGRERPEHRALNGTVVGYDQAFPNGESVPGESTYNCRCLAAVFMVSR